MLKNILKLGTALSRTAQRAINGGNVLKHADGCYDDCDAKFPEPDHAGFQKCMEEAGC